MEDAANKRAEDAQTITVNEGVKADLEANLQKMGEEVKDKMKEAMATAESLKDLHLQCDWLTANYQVRKEARAGEVDSLKRAKAVLSGADYSLLQTKRTLLRRSSLRSKAASGEDILTKTYQLANAPYVVGRHGGENRAASVERAARKRDADSEPLDRLSLGGLGMHDGEDDAIQSSG